MNINKYQNENKINDLIKNRDKEINLIKKEIKDIEIILNKLPTNIFNSIKHIYQLNSVYLFNLNHNAKISYNYIEIKPSFFFNVFGRKLKIKGCSFLNQISTDLTFKQNENSFKSNIKEDFDIDISLLNKYSLKKLSSILKEVKKEIIAEIERIC